MNLGRACRFAGCASVQQCADTRRLRRGWLVYGLLAVLAVWGSLAVTKTARADGGERIALVMAVENYQKLPRSSLGVKRGRDIADGFRAHGFDVIVSTDPSNSAARASLGEFAAKAEGADVAIVVLIGHGTAWAGQSFFLLSNTEISRATDLFSRALSVTNIAQIAGRARAGGVFFFMTAPDFGTPIEGLDARPEFAGQIHKNVVAVFSSSAHVPVSRVDAVSAQAADAMASLLRQPAPTLPELVKAASNGGKDTIVGTAADVGLNKPPAAGKPEASTTGGAQEADKQAVVDARLAAARQARDDAERRARAEQIKTEQAQAEVQKAQAEAKQAQAEAEKAQAEAERVQAEASKAQAEAEQAKLAAQRNEAQAQTASAADTALVKEWQLSREQRVQIQDRLRRMGFYTGPIDAIIGPLTREAIMGFQKSRGARVTGYLTTAEYDVLSKPQ